MRPNIDIKVILINKVISNFLSFKIYTLTFYLNLCKRKLSILENYFLLIFKYSLITSIVSSTTPVLVQVVKDFSNSLKILSEGIYLN